MARDTLDTLTTVCRALADRTRLRILSLLRAGEVCVCDIHESLRLPQSKVSRHLAYLRQAGLVNARKDGLWVHYTLAKWPEPGIQQLVDTAVHAVTHVHVASRDLSRLAARTEVDVSDCQPEATFRCCAPGESHSR
jgi:ArsR family transcriptional regulator